MTAGCRLCGGKPRISRPLVDAMKGCATVIHLASNPDIARATTEPAIDFDAGTFLTHRVVEAMRLSGARRILYASGSGVYGDLGDLIVDEDHGPLLPISTYGASKLAGEALISAYAHMFGLTGCVFRFGNVVGPHQTHGVGFDFIRRLLKDPSHLRILGDGRQSKSYVHVRDVIDAVLLAALRACAGRHVQCCHGRLRHGGRDRGDGGRGCWFRSGRNGVRVQRHRPRLEGRCSRGEAGHQPHSAPRLEQFDVLVSGIALLARVHGGGRTLGSALMTGPQPALRPAVFLDRDGVLNLPLMRDGRPGTPTSVDQLELYPEADEACTRLRQLGYSVVVVSNQPDVARGKLDLETLDAIHRALRRQNRHRRAVCVPTRRCRSLRLPETGAGSLAGRQCAISASTWGAASWWGTGGATSRPASEPAVGRCTSTGTTVSGPRNPPISWPEALPKRYGGSRI